MTSKKEKEENVCPQTAHQGPGEINAFMSPKIIS